MRSKEVLPVARLGALTELPASTLAGPSTRGPHSAAQTSFPPVSVLSGAARVRGPFGRDDERSADRPIPKTPVLKRKLTILIIVLFHLLF